MSKGSFEAKKHAYRQTQDGVVVSFVIHPSDVPADLATAALGTIYMIGFAQVDSDTGDAGSTAKAVNPAQGPAKAPGEADALPSPTKPKERKRWNELRASARAALLSQSDEFLEFAQQHRSYDTNNCANADEWLKKMCRVHSKKEFDTNTDAAQFLDSLTDKYRTWQQARGHGVAA